MALPDVGEIAGSSPDIIIGAVRMVCVLNEIPFRVLYSFGICGLCLGLQNRRS